MAKSFFAWIANQSRTCAALKPPGDVAPVALSATEIDELIQLLGNVRAQILPPHPRVQTADRVLTMVNPFWTGTNELLRDDPLVQIRDPRFGWLSYRFSRDVALKLGQCMLDLAHQPLTRKPPVSN